MSPAPNTVTLFYIERNGTQGNQVTRDHCHRQITGVIHNDPGNVTSRINMEYISFTMGVIFMPR